MAKIISKVLDPKLHDTLMSCGGNFVDMADYAVGRYRNHYPVPATIAETVIVSDTVAIYHTNRDTKILEMVWWKYF